MVMERVNDWTADVRFVPLMKYGRGFRHPCTVFNTVSP